MISTGTMEEKVINHRKNDGKSVEKHSTSRWKKVLKWGHLKLRRKGKRCYLHIILTGFAIKSATMFVLAVGKSMIRMLGSIASVGTTLLFTFSFTLTSAYLLVPQQHHRITTSHSHRWNHVLSPSHRISTENLGQCSSTGKSATSLSLFGSSYGNEDLPNILGINPFEAAFIFGVLYYIFGADTIYEYAREAGRLFSQYAPVVKDLRSVNFTPDSVPHFLYSSV